jgi:hypothetical protein
LSRQRRSPAPAPGQLEQPGDGAAELGELLRKAPKVEAERPRVGGLVRITNVAFYQPEHRWLTTRHRFRVQLIDRLGSRAMLVLQEIDTRDSVAAYEADCEVIS